MKFAENEWTWKGTIMQSDPTQEEKKPKYLPHMQILNYNVHMQISKQ